MDDNNKNQKAAPTKAELEAIKAELEAAKAKADAYEKQIESQGKKAVAPNLEKFNVGSVAYKITIPRVRVDKKVFGFDIIKSDDFIKLSKSNEAKAKEAKALLAKWVKEGVAYVKPA